MAPTVVVVLPEPPSSNRYWRRHGKIIHISAEARAYIHAVAMLTMQYRVDGHCAFPSGDLSVVIIWHRSAKRGDLPNRTKILYDALQGSVYADDRQIAHEETWRVDESATIPKGHMWVEVSAVLPRIPEQTAHAEAVQCVHGAPHSLLTRLESQHLTEFGTPLDAKPSPKRDRHKQKKG